MVSEPNRLSGVEREGSGRVSDKREQRRSSGRRGWRTPALIAGVALLATSGLVQAGADLPGADLAGELSGGAEVAGGIADEFGGEYGSLVFADGDHVIFSTDENEQFHAKGGATAGSSGSHGYRLLGDITLLPHYDVRLVRSNSIEVLRPLIESATSAAAEAGGQSMTVLPGIAEPGGPSQGQIDVMVSDRSPCVGSWLACAGPNIDGGVARSGRVWIHPRLFQKSRHNVENAIRHEIGHVLGLAHYDGIHEGRRQTMHSTSFDAGRYESGDVAGLRAVSHIPHTPEIAISGHRFAAGTGRVEGTIKHATDDLQLGIVVDGEPQYHRVPGSTFAIDVPLAAGPHEVCAQLVRGAGLEAQDCITIGVPSDPFGTVVRAEPSPFGVVVSGWAVDPQTAAPIPVVVTVAGHATEVLADRDHRDAAAHPAYGPKHGFQVLHEAGPGVYDVCVVARNAGAGADSSLGCTTVTISSQSVGWVGLQSF